MICMFEKYFEVQSLYVKKNYRISCSKAFKWL